MAEMRKQRMLVMENGSVHYGFGFGSGKDCLCELVFNTAVVGYQELVTNPGCMGQGVVMTYPLIGNYGITAEDNESRMPALGALIVREYCDEPSNFRYVQTLIYINHKLRHKEIYINRANLEVILADEIKDESLK